MPATLDALLDAALPHVVFDGWSDTTFEAAARDLRVSRAEAKLVAPRGAIDLAVHLHRRGDQAMVTRMAETDLSELRYSERVAKALRIRIEAMPDREAVRRATALFALPANSVEGARLVWETADHVWTALGDTSEDGNWYTKRAILSGVWGSTVLFWLGDDSEGFQNTFDFIDRRIANVMAFEKTKARLRQSPLTKPLMDMQSAFLSKFRAPAGIDTSDLPGIWNRET